MKASLVILMMALLQVNTFSQTHTENLGINHFKTFYQKEEIEIPIHRLSKINDFSFQYHEDTIQLENDLELKSIVKNGFLYSLYKNNDKIARRYYLYSFYEIPLDDKKIRRFKIWINATCRKDLNEICLINPCQYYFEIESNCEDDCKIEDFYRNAKLTYLSKPEIIL